MEILSPSFFTSKGIGVNQPVNKVIKQYGENYVKISNKAVPDQYDMVYGEGSRIVFKINNNQVSRIVIDHP
ncbi:MAG: hypothetical protein U9N81_14765 [Bacillota bacterium]|nr:hypothetical protein [Bacillota bacterium]